MVDGEPILFEILDTCPKVKKEKIEKKLLHLRYFWFKKRSPDSGYLKNGIK